MPRFFKKILDVISNFVYKNMETTSGSMILLTSVVGITLSTLAQAGAILLNKNYSTSQKAFMAPQKLAEGGLTVLTMLAVIAPLQKLATRYANTGKILTKDLKTYLEKYSLLENRGHKDFNIKKSIINKIDDIKNSDGFSKCSQDVKESMLKEHLDTLNSFERTFDATSAIATTVGGIVSTTAISPLLRNTIASSYQKVAMNTLSNNYAYKSDLKI